MTTLQLNEELQRQLGYISDDAELMKKAINYIKELGKLRNRVYTQSALDKDIEGLTTAFYAVDISQEDIDSECEAVREERYKGRL